MNKEEMAKEISEELSTLKDHADSLNKLIEDLQATLRPTGDVTFTTMERTKTALASFTDSKVSLEKVRKALKARAAARNKEV